MGLDMYLNTAPKIDGYTFEEIMEVEKEIFYDINDVPEDLRLYVRRQSITNWLTLTEKIGYWRKAWPIHNWFVNNVQNGIDECEPHLVSKEQLESLLRLVNDVLENKLSSGSNNTAHIALPNGMDYSTDDRKYNDNYYKDLIDAREFLKEALAINEDDYYIYYRSSW